MFKNKCPVCGTQGKVWHRKPEVFRCPNCSSIFSDFGVVVESDDEQALPWN